MISTIKIEFKGKCEKTNKWVHGDLIQDINRGTCFIFPFNKQSYPEQGVKVDSDTVCQRTNAIDTDGNNLFTGDIFYVGQNDFALFKVVWFRNGFHYVAYNNEPGQWTWPLPFPTERNDTPIHKVCTIFDTKKLKEVINGKHV